MTDQLRVRMTGPLTPFKAGFAAELRRLGYAPRSASNQVQFMADLSRWLEAEGLSAHEFSPANVERFLEDRRAAGHTHQISHRGLAPLLAFLRELGAVAPAQPAPPPAGPLEELLCRYRRYLAAERGLKEKTARQYVDAIRPFLSERMSRERPDLARLSAADVSAFALASARQQTPGTAKHTVGVLRSLLGFLHREGVIEQSLIGAVPRVASWRGAGLPKGLGPDQLQSLLGSCDRTSANGERDFAILTLLSRLGLRAGEVAGLALEDIDWRAGEIVVRGKGRRSERLPLPADVGEAIGRVLAIPPKRFQRNLVTFLTEEEVEALLAAPDRSTWTGRRDYAMLMLAAQTGLRASELTGLRCADLHLGRGPHVSCLGKGRKQRITPLTSATVAVLRVWLAERGEQPQGPLLPTRVGGRLSRDGLERRLAKHVASAATTCPSLREKKVTAHVLRHTAAMRLLQAGVDTSVIALWLGHEQVETTQIYLHADLAIKQRALARTTPAGGKPGRYRPPDAVLAFLEGL